MRLYATAILLLASFLVIFSTCNIFLVYAVSQNTTATLSGLVTDSDGAVIAEASVTAINRRTGVARRTKTNEEGKYTLANLDIGDYEVKVESTGFAPAVKEVALSVGQSASLDFILPIGSSSMGTIKGTVRDNSNAPIPGAEVTIIKRDESEPSQTQTNEHGYYEKSALTPGEYLIKVKADGFRPAEAKPIKLEERQTRTLDFTLQRQR